MKELISHKCEEGALSLNRANGYVYIKKSDHPNANSSGWIYQHVAVMESHTGKSIPDGWIVHHINGNKSDNRIENLRIMNWSEHSRLHSNHFDNKSSSSASKYKGVSWSKSGGKWRAKIQFNKKCIHLGCFDKEIDAAKAYDVGAKRFFGDLAFQNFSNSETTQAFGGTISAIK